MPSPQFLVFGIVGTLVSSACGNRTADGETDSTTGQPDDDSPIFAPGEIIVAPSPMCPGIAGGVCSTLTVRCAGLTGASAVPDAVAVVKVLPPPGISIGTIVMSTGNDAEGHWGRTLYEANGAEVVLDLRAKGYTTAQIAWRADGVNAGPGGMKLLSCRYATVAKWIFDGTGTTPKANPGIHEASTPFGATGNSGGGGIIAIAIAFHGLGEQLDKIVLSSAPVVFDLRHSCIAGIPVPTSCGQAPATDAYEEPAAASARASLDRSYGWVETSAPSAAPCQNHDETFSAFFEADSISGNLEARTLFPHTDIVQILGTADGSSAKTIATAWFLALRPANTRVRETQCVNAPHALTATAEGRDAIKAQFTTGVFVLRH